MRSIGRFLTALGLIGTVVVVFVLYAIKHDTRLLDQRVRQLERMVDRSETDVAILRAEWSHLTQPERIERLARKYLGFRPLSPAQYGKVADITLRREQRGRRVPQ